MEHEPDVGLVDSHAEGGGGHHHVQPAVEELLVDQLPLGGGAAGVIGLGSEAVPGQLRCVSLGVFPFGRVHQPGPAPRSGESGDASGDQFGDLVDDGAAFLLVLMVALHFQADVGPVEAVDQDQRDGHAEAGQDLLAHRGRGGGCQRSGGRVAQALADLAEPEVVGPEIVAPGGDAVGLVHHEQGDVQRRDPFHRACLGELFRGEEEERRLAAFHRPPGALLLGGAVRGVDRDGDARPRSFPQPVQLVLLEGDQRGHDDGGPLQPAVQQERGDLVDGRLPVAGGHDGKDVPADGEGAHPGELAFPEVRQVKGDVREVAEVGVVVRWKMGCRGPVCWKLERRGLERRKLGHRVRLRSIRAGSDGLGHDCGSVATV